MPADVSELEALAAEYKQAGTRIRREQRKVVRSTVESITSDARAAAPVRTGELQGSIEGTVRGLRGKVEASARYSFSMEYGTYKDAPQPFMTPAVDANEPRYLADSEAAAARAIDG